MTFFRPQKSSLAVLAGTLTAFFLSGCTSTGTSDNPFVRKTTWFSYLNGDDIRAACQPGSDDRFRLIFNGRYDDEVRIYDVGPVGGAPMLKEKILTSTIVNQGFTLNSIESRLAGQDYTVSLGATGNEALWSSLEQAGAFQPAIPGTRLESDSLWWTVTGCKSGTVFFQVWPQTQDSGPPPFFKAVASYDPSGLPFPSAAPKPVTTLDSPRDRTKQGNFLMEVGSNGGFIR